ncbi:MAG: purine-binding chemotaxis protein CheW [Steroidobacteraceae bacterium]|nr:purine-binding chemotaxis protein CheW [Steroidobacteraceae bacterium]
MQPEPTLRALRDRPFELLLALEKRARDVVAGAREGAAAQEWIGVAFRMGGETFLVERDEAREVMGVPSPITRVPGARSWIMGLANVRGQLLPVIDLKQYFGSGETVAGRNTRVIVVNHREIPAGLVVDEVLGFRRFAEREFNAESPPTLIRCEHYLAGSFRRGSEAWPVISLRSLVESAAFLQGSA